MPEIDIYTGPGCGYCERAKALLTREGHTYREHSIADPEALADMRARLPRERTIPQIFVDGRHIGGCEDLELAIERGTL